jgi:hypothetical protein
VQLDRNSFLRKSTHLGVESAPDHATCGGLLRRNSILWRPNACLGEWFLVKTQATNSEDEAARVERSLFGVSSAKDEAAGVDVGMSCTVGMSGFWYLAPRYSPTTVCPCMDRKNEGRYLAFWRLVSKGLLMCDLSRPESEFVYHHFVAMVSTVVNRRPTPSYDDDIRKMDFSLVPSNVACGAILTAELFGRCVRHECGELIAQSILHELPMSPHRS